MYSVTNNYDVTLIFRVKWETYRTTHVSDDRPTENVNSNSSKLIHKQIDEERFHYMSNYAICMIIVLCLVLQRALGTVNLCLRASRKLHDKLFRGVIQTAMNFFHANNSGRIINRFASDIGFIDLRLPYVLYEAVHVKLNLIFLFMNMTSHSRTFTVYSTNVCRIVFGYHYKPVAPDTNFCYDRHIFLYAVWLCSNHSMR